jgi:uncharacterized membrane protein
MLIDLMKSGTLSLLHVGVAFGVALAITGSPVVAAGIALIEPSVMSFATLLHARVWRLIEPPTGRASRA